MPNRLVSESSLYLRQHAEQPVHWWPWGAEALAEARRRDVPVIVSIGYSACHWCHVMARESFDSPFIAKLMNEHFVCIKVDREERPDVDRVYMETVQMLNGHGGWPLNAFCLPDGRPFAGGTYFPPDDSRSPGIVPWPVLLMRVSEHFKRHRKDLEENADGILENLAASNAPLAPRVPGAPLQNSQLLDAARALCAQHDDEHGGFGSAPKFPPHGTLDFLLGLRAARAVDADPGLAARMDTVVHRTLTAMAHGGIYDQVGGGFARYAVDRVWLIPHFEKMLYDNGQLLSAYALGWRRSGKPLYRAVAEETAAWLDREMSLPGGVYAAALDADTDHHEGLTYVWTPAQVRDLLGEADGNRFCAAYCITDDGTFEEGTSQAALGEADFDERRKLAPLRQKLLAARNLRPQPGRDAKALTAWNALAIKGLADCGWAFGDKTLLRRAVTAAEWLWQNHRDANGRLLSVSHGGKASQPAFLDDHAFFADAALALSATADWLEPGLGKLWRERAQSLADAVIAHFADREGQPGFYFTADDAETPVSRRKEWFDNAIPAGNSVLVRVFASLYALTGDNTYADPLASLRAAYPGLAERVPGGVPTALAGFAAQALGIAVVKVKGISDLEPLRAALAARPPRPVFVQLTDDPAQPEGYQLCVGTQCLAPTDDAAEVAARL